MDFKQFILNERLYERAMLGKGQFAEQVDVYIDPTPSDLRLMGKWIRGFTEDQHVFMWNGENGGHHQIAASLQLRINAAFYMSKMPDGKYALTISGWSTAERDVYDLMNHPQMAKLKLFLVPMPNEEDDDDSSMWGSD